MGPRLNVFYNYFYEVWPWLLGVAAGIAVLWGVAGGIMLMLGGTPDDKWGAKQRILWALMGLLMVATAGIILNILNPLVYT